MKPDDLLINGHTWKVGSIAENQDEYCAGQCMFGGGVRELRFRPDLQDDPETVIHEVLHALYREYNIAPHGDEEHVVTNLAIGLVQVLRDNASLRKLLLAPEGDDR